MNGRINCYKHPEHHPLFSEEVKIVQKEHILKSVALTVLFSGSFGVLKWFRFSNPMAIAITVPAFYSGISRNVRGAIYPEEATKEKIRKKIAAEFWREGRSGQVDYVVQNGLIKVNVTESCQGIGGFFPTWVEAIREGRASTIDFSVGENGAIDIDSLMIFLDCLKDLGAPSLTFSNNCLLAGFNGRACIVGAENDKYYPLKNGEISELMKKLDRNFPEILQDFHPKILK